MATINVEVIRVEVENKGKYNAASVIYKGPEGKVDNKKLVSFTNKEVFKTMSAAQPGDVFQVTSEKDTNGYWQWTSASPSGKNVGTSDGGGASVKSSPSPRSTYETPEERAARQVYIVRQSSVANAVALLKDAKRQVTADEVIATAKDFEAYVFAQEPIVEPEVE